nr:murein L,D-transpeptidase catalytic domain family protein [Parasphingorhabdus halotolerans]
MNRRIFLSAGVIGLGAAFAGSVPALAKSIAKLDPELLTPELLAPKLLAKARAALDTHGKLIAHKDIIGIADYSLHSSKRRFHLVDLMNGRTTSLLVAHGKGSDRKHSGWLQQFSNVPGSEASSGAAMSRAKPILENMASHAD